MSDQSTKDKKLDQALHALAEIHRLLEEYAPLWYSPLTEKRVRAALKAFRG